MGAFLVFSIKYLVVRPIGGIARPSFTTQSEAKSLTYPHKISSSRIKDERTLNYAPQYKLLGWNKSI